VKYANDVAGKKTAESTRSVRINVTCIPIV
jgi:hypothetical protein